MRSRQNPSTGVRNAGNVYMTEICFTGLVGTYTVKNASKDFVNMLKTIDETQV